MNYAVYISGHGFGHLAQLAPVLNSLYARQADARFLLRTPLPRAELSSRLAFDFQHDPVPVDIGVIQKNAIEEDRQGSIKAMREWVATMPRQINREASVLREFSADMVISNISPLAFPAAAAIGIPSLGLASLDWHTIYAHWLEPDDPVLQGLAAAYGQCDLLLSPPMAMEMPVFPNRETIPLIAAVPTDVRFSIRDGYDKRALVVFGGAGQPPFDMAALAAMSDWLFLIPDAPADAPANVQNIEFSETLRPVDVMAQIDVVICKPGYGVLAESWRTGKPIAWVERPDFPEFPMLRAWLDEQFPAAGMSGDDFRAGRWQSTLEQALACRRSYPMIDGDGGFAAVELILSQATSSR